MNYADFFTNVRELCTRINRPPEDLGFNPFALMSDMYYRENFHSDIIRAILDPNGPHRENDLFLLSFVNLLAVLAVAQNKPIIAENLRKLRISDEVVVSREDYRTDIAIYSARDHWSILIENKINNAVDQNHQLVRYLDGWTKDKLDVKPVAIVYLTPAYETVPDMHDWSDEDRNKVSALLVSLAGYKPEGKCLYDWLRHCELDSLIFNNKAVLSQYAALVKQQAGTDMNEKDFQVFLEQVATSQINIDSLIETVNQLPQFYASWLHRKLQAEMAEMSFGDKAWIYSGHVAVFDFHVNTGGRNIRLAFDIPCNCLTQNGITFFSRDEPAGENMDLFKDVLKSLGYSFNEGWRRWEKKCCPSKYPTVSQLEQFWKEMKDSMIAIKRRKEELELN